MKKLLALGAAAVLFAGCSTTTTTTVEPTSSPAAEVESTPSPDAMMEATPSPVVAMVPTPMADGSLQVKLGEQNTSGQSGTAAFKPTKDGKVIVTIELTGGKFTAAQPAHIHEGSCPTPGSVKFPLTNVVNGKSSTTLNVSMADLLKAAPKLAVNVHKSAAEVSTYTACGDIQ